MNIKIIDGYVTVDGIFKVSATYKLLTMEGIDICIPKEKQPTKVESLCGNCFMHHDHNAPCPQTSKRIDPCPKCCHRHDPNMSCFVANESITRLLESLAMRFETKSERWPKTEYGAVLIESANVFRAEKEQWK